MKLKFTKDSNGEISVKILENNEYICFDYSDMIKQLYDSQEVENAEICGSFTDMEKKSIEDIIQGLKQAIKNTNDDFEEAIQPNEHLPF